MTAPQMLLDPPGVLPAPLPGVAPTPEREESERTVRRQLRLLAGRLRREHANASLEELGALADPALTKDAIAGRIRRLLAMADARAAASHQPDFSRTDPVRARRGPTAHPHHQPDRGGRRGGGG